MDIYNPRATVWLNEEGKLQGLPVNQRATAMLWVHNSRFLAADVLCGDVFITGRPDERGNDTTVPVELVKLLLETRRWQVTFKLPNGISLARRDRPPGTFDRWDYAYIYAADLAARFRELVRDIKVVSADG